MITLKELLEDIRIDQSNSTANPAVTGLAYHSARVAKGTLFFCLRGLKTDGHRYLGQAKDSGAAAAVVENIQPQVKLPQYCVADSRRALAAAAARFYDHPSQKMKVIGVTGTNGKTTTTYFIRSIFEEGGCKAAILGSNGLIAKGIRRKFDLTTPQSLELQSYLNFSFLRGVQLTAMEVSSHALVQQRVAHCFFDSAVYTNLSWEHLDYHHTMQEYLEAKSKLLTLLKERPRSGAVILNADDLHYRELAARAAGLQQLSYGIETGSADIRAINLAQTETGQYSFDLLGWSEPVRINLQLPGIFNVYNALAAAAAASREGLAPEVVAAGLNGLSQVPGRYEEIVTPAGFTVIVDFAHTPDGLEQILKLLSLRQARRRITVFGCPGERDRKKRPLMGRIADLYSDEVILTTDNPAGEDAAAIIEDILQGMRRTPLVIPDRREAVYYALAQARPGDIVLLAGKGAEEYQLIGEQALPYNERETVENYLRETSTGSTTASP